MAILNLTGGIAYWYNKDFDAVCQLMEDKLSDWHDQYDERYCNEPEYPSQQDRWQDALDSFEERIDALEDIERHYKDWLDKFKKQYKDGTPRDMVHRPYLLRISFCTGLMYVSCDWRRILTKVTLSPSRIRLSLISERKARYSPKSQHPTFSNTTISEC